MQIAFFFDQTRCTCCQACTISCKDWHDIQDLQVNWLQVDTIEMGKYPNPFVAYLRMACHHCVEPSCVAACPAEAITKRESDGVVLVDREKCLGRDECGQPCSDGCPIGNDVRGFVSLIKQGKIEEAKRLILETNPFPGITGRICFHPCESECNRGQVDSATAIHALERFASTATVEAPVVAVTRPERVAVVGSGPAGLSCAYHLAKRGYRVTVFEAEPMAGGMLRVIPEYRLPEVVLNQEIAFVESTGVTIKTGMRLGENLTKAELDAFDAVFLAIGAGREKMLDIPGIDSDRVIGSLNFLKKARQGEVQCAGEQVLVLGGGNVAFDCARMARRLGASEVHLTCLEASDGMLADASEIQQAEEEGIVIHPSRSFCRVIREAGEVTGVECLSLSSMCFEEDGSLTIDPIAGSEHILPASMVIVAIGATPDVTFLPDTVSVSRGMILTNPTGATSRARYFAGGDATASTRRVAYAIASGQQVALSIVQFLNNAKVDVLQMPSRVTSKLIDPDAFEKKDRTAIPTLPAEERLRGLKEVALGFSPEQAAAEADRCLDCRGMCKLVCAYDAPQFGAESNAKMQKCIFCTDRLAEGKKAICVDACGQYALDCGPLDVLQAKYGDTSYAVGFEYSDNMKPSIIFKPKPRKESQNV